MEKGFSAEKLNKKETSKAETISTEEKVIWKAYQRAKANGAKTELPFYNEFIVSVKPLIKEFIRSRFISAYFWVDFSETDVDEALSEVFLFLARPESKSKEKLFSEDINNFPALKKFLEALVYYGTKNFFAKKRKTEEHEITAGQPEGEMNIEEEIVTKDLLRQALKQALFGLERNYRLRAIEIFLTTSAAKQLKKYN